MVAPAAPTLTRIAHKGDGLFEIIVDEQAGTTYYNLYAASQIGIGIGAAQWIERKIGLISAAGGRGGPATWKIRSDLIRQPFVFVKMTGFSAADEESVASNEIVCYLKDQPNKFN